MALLLPPNLLREEQIGSVDYFVACTDRDEDNIGAKNIMFVVNKGDHNRMPKDISYKLGIQKIVANWNTIFPGKNVGKFPPLTTIRCTLFNSRSPRMAPVSEKYPRRITWPRALLLLRFATISKPRYRPRTISFCAGDHMVIFVPTDKQEQIDALFL